MKLRQFQALWAGYCLWDSRKQKFKLFISSDNSSYLQHFLLVDDGLLALRCEEEAGGSPPVVGLVQQPLADLEEGGPLVRQNVPAVAHQVKHDVVTVLRPLHLVSILDIFHDLIKTHQSDLLSTSTVTKSNEFCRHLPEGIVKIIKIQIHVEQMPPNHSQGVCKNLERH